MELFFFLLILLFLLLFMGVPVAYSISGACIIVLAVLRGLDKFPFEIVAQRMLYGTNNFTLLTIPAFLLIGKLMNSSGITDKIFDVARSLVGHYKGGLGHVNIVASIIFAGMSGSAVADAGGLGAVEIKAMTDDGYPKGFSAAVTGASATIGPIIPPSIPAVIYGAIANASIGKIFIGSIVPGLIMGLGMMILVAFISHIKGYPTQQKASLAVVIQMMGKGLLPLLTPLIIIVGILSGIFTATEASAIALVYCIFLASIVYRSLTLKDFIKALKETMIDTAILLFIIAGCSVYSWMLGRYQVTHGLVAFIESHVGSPFTLMIYLNMLLLLIGCFIDAVPALFLLTPILIPLITKFGIDPVHFGVVMIFNLMIGLITPPVGTVLYTLQKITNIPMETLIKNISPFYIPLFISLILITYFPKIVMFLPNIFL